MRFDMRKRLTMILTVAIGGPLVAAFLWAGTGWAAGQAAGQSSSGALPPADWFVPEMASVPVQPFLWAINWLVGLVAVLVLGYAIFKLVLVAKDLIAGRDSLEGKRGYFVGAGVALVVLLMALTGTWYTLLLWMWTKVLMPMAQKFGA